MMSNSTERNENVEVKKEKEIKLALEELWAKEEESEAGETAVADTPTYRELKDIADKAEAEAAEMKELAQRLKAEFDNYRKRTMQEKELWKYQALESLLADLLSVLDDFGRALDAARNAKEAQSVVEGIEMISSRLFRMLAGHGLERIACVGETFDPEVHEAVLREECSTAAAGTILEELQPGYRFKDQILRHPKVKVAVEAAG